MVYSLVFLVSFVNQLNKQRGESYFQGYLHLNQSIQSFFKEIMSFWVLIRLFKKSLFGENHSY
jgi:hypothetical protein